MTEPSTTSAASETVENTDERISVVTPPSVNNPAILTMNGDKNTPSTTASSKSRDRNTTSINNGQYRQVKTSDGTNARYPIQQPQQQTSQYPPSQIVYQTNNGSSNGSHSSNGSEDQNGGERQQQEQPHPSQLPTYPPTHSRDGSWSGGVYGIAPPVIGGYPPMPSLYPPGMSPPPIDPRTMMPGTVPGVPPSMMPSPMYPGVLPASPQFPPQNIAAMMAANQDTIGSTVSASSRRSKRKDYPGHRRVHSYNGYSTNNQSYGSMDVSAFFAPPGVLPPTAPRTPRTTAAVTVRPGGGKHNRSESGEFSPVSEIRNLAGRSPRRSPVMSPRLTSSLRDGNFLGAPIPPPLMMPTAQGLDAAGSLNQYQQSPRPMMPRRDVFMGSDDERTFIHSSSSPISNSIHGSLRCDGRDMGGEAVFFLKEDGDNKSRKYPQHKSSRKMHMRQKSAQLFMEDVKGTDQIPSCRDIIFLLLFVFHLIGIVYLGNTYGYESQRLHDDTMENSDTAITVMYANLIYIAGLSGIIAVVISALALLLMMSIAQKIVHVALALAVTFSFVWGTMGIGLSPKKIVPVIGIIALALIIAYAFIVWDRIPFTAVNLDAGLKGIRANPGAIVVAFFFQLLALGWSIYYTFVVMGTYDAVQLGNLGEFRGADNLIYVLLVISYYWTLNVFLNVVQVTVAGVIGRWWYKPDGDSTSNGSDLLKAFFRSCFYSLGSICYGSLIVGPVRILRQLSVFFRPSEELNSLLCLHECIYFIQTCMTSCVDSLGDRYNSYAFTYIGLYGYGLVDAGLHSTELFEKRGWTTIVSDDLVPNVLSMISLGIGGLTGMVAYMLEKIEVLSLTSLGVPWMTSFVIGALVGLVVSSVLFGIISSSVSAVIVLFASSPVDFEHNHPQLSEEMRSAWREVWPGCMDVIDMRVQVAGYLDPTLNGTMTTHTNERHPLLP
ncbi:plasma-membrane choline transporter family protein [Nitzschia inconspicua]|uniref:Plasma-membrane choline transporter family protein n=1 Tax=Nitzschia inconspicua TaxID=303405 RepID=A0A9K3LWQ4_9STRA|nr:plasma-membrane choline transporter family protein [Nitzschia inconspicua]